MSNDSAPKHLWTRTSRGKPFAYYRKSGIVERVHDADGKNLVPGMPGFEAAFAQAGKAVDARLVERASKRQAIEQKPAGGDAKSLGALIRLYCASVRYRDLAPDTRVGYERGFKLLAKWHGAHVPALDPPRVQGVIDGVTAGKSKAAAERAISTLSILCGYARAPLGWIKTNPCDDAFADRRKRHKAKPYPAWLDTEFRQFIDSDRVHDALKRVVVMAYYTGLRISDLIAVPKTARKDGVLETITSKTGARAYIPEHPELTAWLDAQPPHDKPTLLVSQKGLPWTRRNLGQLIREAVARVGLRRGLSCHGLRKSLHIAVVEAGGSDAEVSALVPHADPRMTAAYRAEANQRLLAQAAMRRLLGPVKPAG